VPEAVWIEDTLEEPYPCCSMNKGLGPICAFYDEIGVGGASRRALAALRLGFILRLEQIGLVLSMTMTDQHVV
jgi:hypothetical protein